MWDLFLLVTAPLRWINDYRLARDLHRSPQARQEAAQGCLGLLVLAGFAGFTVFVILTAQKP